MKTIETICLIDDDKVFAFLTKMIIKESRLVNQIKLFDYGLDALDFLESVATQNQKFPDLILLDLNMPIMDGWEFLERYRELEARLTGQIAIYILSSSISLTDINKAKHYSSVKGYLTKPMTREVLTEVINAI